MIEKNARLYLGRLCPIVKLRADQPYPVYEAPRQSKPRLLGRIEAGETLLVIRNMGNERIERLISDDVVLMIHPDARTLIPAQDPLDPPLRPQHATQSTRMIEDAILRIRHPMSARKLARKYDVVLLTVEQRPWPDQRFSSFPSSMEPALFVHRGPSNRLTWNNLELASIKIYQIQEYRTEEARLILYPDE